MSYNPIRSRILYFIKSQEDDVLQLLIANNSQSKEGKYLNQISANTHQIVFEVQRKINIYNINYSSKIQIQCQEINNQVIVTIPQFQKIQQEIIELSKDQDEEEFQDEEEESQEQQHPSNGDHHVKLEEGADNYPFLKKEFIDQDQESSNNLQHRGRGRPKGAKNKKTILKQKMQLKQMTPIDMKMSINGSKRGKGRPKGSKNKVKDFTHPIKFQVGHQSMSFGKRGKGRPKGSKNKIKLQAPLFPGLEAEKRQKGRPLGSKNRAYSMESAQQGQQEEQQFVRIQIMRPQTSNLQNQCCPRCQQSKIKRKILESQTNVEENIQELKNVYQDVSLENKSNLIITAIKIGDWQSLGELLSIIDQQCAYHNPPWKVEHMIQRQRFQTKTKRQYLSKTGKEGNIVLLHDCFQKKQIWWKQITLQRIIQNLPRQQPQTDSVLDKLFSVSSELKKQIFNNIASVVRSGNFAASQTLLRQLLINPQINKVGFSQDYYDLLMGNIPQLNHLKKFNLIQRNSGPNFCSPIHSAAISDNSQFLRKLLQIFTDVINVEDNLRRRPIHYAALSMNTQNLSVLVENGADLKDYDINKKTPLMLSCYQGMFYNVEYILQKIRDPNYINFKSDQGYTALHYAILQNNIQCIQLLLNDPYIDLWVLTKDRGDIFHLLAGTGNIQIFELILKKKEVLPYTSHDKYKRTPPMIAIRNNNNDCFVKLIENGCKIDKVDSSMNTLLHYAAAYGNIQAILILKDKQDQCKNKKGLYPWEVAIHKGHLGAAKLLQPDQPFDFVEDPLYFALSNIRGTAQYMNCIRYIKDKMMSDIDYQQKSFGNGYLHLICQANEQQYIKVRKEQTNISVDEIRDQFNWVLQQLINMFVIEEGLDGYLDNYFGQTPVKMCIQNNNLIGLQKLLTKKITFEIQPSSGNTVLHCLSCLGCRGLQELKFVQKKLKQCNQNQLKANIKKVDHNGFDFLLFFVKSFVENAARTFKKFIKKQLISIKTKKDSKIKASNMEIQAEKKALQQFYKFQDKILNLIQFLCDLGCDINAQVAERKSIISTKYKKWGIQHFLMKFPSLKLLKYFKSKIRDFNLTNAQMTTPLLIFCQFNKKGSILDTKLNISDQYKGQFILQYLLSNGLNPNIQDSTKSFPILQAAKKSQYEFILLLCQFKSQINFCNINNQSPLIQIVKSNQEYTIKEIQQLLKLGMDPNFIDKDKRNPLHHLVFNSNSLQSTSELLKLLVNYGCKINGLDKYDRSPIFYCFCQMQDQIASQPLQKMEILQVLINHKDINLNLVDVYKRTILHYACQKNHFFSILYLLDKNINIEAKDYQENTPLALTLRTRNLDQAALLISKGVRYGFVNDDENKLSYFAYAYKNLSAGICFMLLDHGYPIQKALQQIPKSGFKQTLIHKYIMK